VSAIVTNQQDIRNETPRGLIVHFNISAAEHLGQVRVISALRTFIKLYSASAACCLWQQQRRERPGGWAGGRAGGKRDREGKK